MERRKVSWTSRGRIMARDKMFQNYSFSATEDPKGLAEILKLAGHQWGGPVGATGFAEYMLSVVRS